MDPIAPAHARVPVVLNSTAGRGASEEAIRELGRRFAAHGLEAEIRVASSGMEAVASARELLRDAPPILVAAGGDGTVSSIASCVQGTTTALGVLPLGTLNHFARDLAIPADLDAAIGVIASGRIIDVDMGVVNGQHFINNASLGLYPDIVLDRTRQQRRLGRGKYWAMMWATLAALRRSSFVHITLELDGKARTGRAPFVFIGNNDYVMEGFQIGKRASLRGGRLSVYTTRRHSRLGLVALALRALVGRLDEDDDFLAESVTVLRVESRHRYLRVATDGEVSRMRTPLEFRPVPGALRVVAPGSAQ